MEGLSNKYKGVYKGNAEKGIEELDALFDEMKEYFAILRGGIY